MRLHAWRIAVLASFIFSLNSFAVEEPIYSNLHIDCELEGGLAPPVLAEFQEIYFQFLSHPSVQCKKVIANECSGPKVDPLWFIDATNADLMFQEMRNWRARHPGRPRVKVAVVDGGFGPNMESLLTPGPFTTARVSDKPSLNNESHGALVAQFVRGHYGLAPEAELYTYNARGQSEGIIDGEVAEESIRHACSMGQRIINASFGVSKAYAPDKEIAAFSALVDELAGKGCLLVNAAGNDSVRDSALISKYSPMYKNYLAVGATRKSGGVSGFSDEASVYAPGEQVWAKVSPGIVGKCFKGEEVTVDGTSFASPIVHAIATNVLEVLSESKRFQALNPRQQVEVIMEIVRTSSISPTADLDAYAAVKGAQAWASGGEVPETSPQCPPIPTKCFRSTTHEKCESENECSSVLRKLAVDCPREIAKSPHKFLLAAGSISPELAFRLAEVATIHAQGNEKLRVRKTVNFAFPSEYWKKKVESMKFPYEGRAALLDQYLRVRLPNIQHFSEWDHSLVKSLFRLSSFAKRHEAELQIRALARNEIGSDLLVSALREAVLGAASGQKRILFGSDIEDVIKILTNTNGRVPQIDRALSDLIAALPADQAFSAASIAGVCLSGAYPVPNPQLIVEALLKNRFASAKYPEKTKDLIDQLEKKGLFTSEKALELREKI